MEDKTTKIKKCTVCGGEAKFLGQVPIRTKGHGGVSKLFFGEWAELGEEMWPIDIYRCKNCRHLELYDLDASLSKK